LRTVFVLVGSTLLTGCPGTLNQIAGTGAIYQTRCSATMEVKGETFVARCTPPSCTDTFTSGPVSHLVVALDPGKKIVGVAERICYQDLKDASHLFKTPTAQELASQQKNQDAEKEPEERPSPNK
jgi:hypothetical protein